MGVVAHSEHRATLVVTARLRPKDFPDLSGYTEGHVDFKVMRKHGIRYVGLRALAGRTDTDDRYWGFRHAAERHGISVITYAYCRPDNNAPEAEVRALLDFAGRPSHGDFPFIPDIEVSCEESWWTHWLRAYHRATGHLANVTYGGATFRDTVKPLSRHGTHLWYPQYSGTRVPHTLLVPKPWGDNGPIIHQWTETGTCPGVPGRCDMNRVRIRTRSLEKLRV